MLAIKLSPVVAAHTLAIVGPEITKKLGEDAGPHAMALIAVLQLTRGFVQAGIVTLEKGKATVAAVTAEKTGLSIDDANKLMEAAIRAQIADEHGHPGRECGDEDVTEAEEIAAQGAAAEG